MMINQPEINFQRLLTLTADGYGAMLKTAAAASRRAVAQFAITDWDNSLTTVWMGLGFCNSAWNINVRDSNASESPFVRDWRFAH